MKTISDIMIICRDVMFQCCDPQCSLCDRLRFCHVNTAVIAFEMLLTTGEYH